MVMQAVCRPGGVRLDIAVIKKGPQVIEVKDSKYKVTTV